MSAFEALYPELYTVVDEALLCFLKGKQEEEACRLLQGQVHTVEQILSEL